MTAYRGHSISLNENTTASISRNEGKPIGVLRLFQHAGKWEIPRPSHVQVELNKENVSEFVRCLQDLFPEACRP